MEAWFQKFMYYYVLLKIFEPGHLRLTTKISHSFTVFFAREFAKFS